jgi:hypothetical protein
MDKFITASLIHEVRMIVKHIMGRKMAKDTADSMFAPSGGLMCAVCLVRKVKKPARAITIVDGRATCRDHIVLS